MNYMPTYLIISEQSLILQDGSQASLNLKNVAGIFYILSCGLIISIVVAGVEFLYKTIVDSRKSKVYPILLTNRIYIYIIMIFSINRMLINKSSING